MARAIAAAARAELGTLPPVDGFMAQPGLGARGTVDGHEISVGKADLFADGTATVPVNLPQRCAEWEIARAHRRARRVATTPSSERWRIADTIRPSAAAAVRELQALGLHCVLLTGDNEPTARAVGADDRGDRRGGRTPFRPTRWR